MMRRASTGTPRMRMFPGLAVALAATTLAIGACAAPSDPRRSPPPNEGLLIRHVALIDGTGAPLRTNVAIGIRGARIVAVGDDPSDPNDLRPVDGRGLYAIPGLWDMHVHVLRHDRPAYLPLYVAWGIVGVRDMGGDLSFADIATLRSRIASGALIGPELVAAGPILDGEPATLSSISVGIANSDTGRAQVRRLKSGGADFIKVYNRLDRDSFLAIADEARRQGLPLAGHVPFSVSAREASDAGMISIEHLFNVLFACSAREDELMRDKAAARETQDYTLRRIRRHVYLRGVLDSYDPPRAQALFRRFAANGTYQVPTLVQRRAFAEPAARERADDPRMHSILRSERDWWSPETDWRVRRDPADQEIEQRYYAQDRALIRPMLAAGVKFLAGSDSPDAYSFPGSSLHEELELLVAAGLTPMQALQSATANAATFLGRSAESGTIVPGQRADLVLLEANPLDDIRNTRRVAGVIRSGRYLDRGELRNLVAQTQAELELR